MKKYSHREDDLIKSTQLIIDKTDSNTSSMHSELSLYIALEFSCLLMLPYELLSMALRNLNANVLLELNNLY